MTDQLFQPIKLGKQLLEHRVALAPLTRLRNIEYVPTKPIQPTYYQQRSTKGGLLITEATIIMPSGGSYKLAPGIWSSEQVNGWKKVTQAVHDKDGIIYCQLWHLGRASAATYEYKGTKYPPVSASATKVNDKAEVSKELTIEEIQEIVKAFGNASKLAIEAGFDGIEIHGANGYLVDQFLQNVSNHRQDKYGGSLENRLRFPLEVVESCVQAIGEERVSIRFSPFSEFQGMKEEKPYDTFIPYIKELISRYPNLAYIHGVESRLSGGQGDKKPEEIDENESLQPFRDIVEESNKKVVNGGSGVRFITAGGCTPENSLKDAEKNKNDLFAFGRHFIANPDLPARIQNRWPLNPYDRSTFYTQEAEGYTDQPFYKEMSRAEDSSSSTSSMNHQNEDLEKSSRVDETGRQIVKFDEPGKTPGDPSNPRAWLKSYKWLCLMVLNNCSLCVTMTSSVISLSYGGIKEDFGIGQEVATLGLSLFVLGLSLGPLLFGPLSEFYGRRPIYLWTYAAFLLLGFPVAFSNNAAVFFIFRFLTGISGSAFLSVAGGTVSDCFNNREIVIPMVIYSSFPFFGPVLGPILGGFINQHASWRWSFYMVLIWSAANIFLIYFFSPETFAPIILTNKAKALRKRGNENAISEHEIKMAGKSVSQTIIISSKRVFLMLIFEPILLLLCIWSALLLSILYCFFGAFPIVFRQKNFNLQSQGLSFLGLAVGMILALLSSTFWKNRYLRRMDEAEAKGEEVPPEARLGQAKVGAFLSVIGLFCFAFTSYQHVHWSAAIISSIPFGASIILIFASVFTFTSDVYGPAGVAASALCANSFVRCLSSAAFPLFTRQMYHALTPVGASALLAGLNVLMIPLPFVFYKYGAAIRAKSRFAT